jgi:hypothetical protein
MEYAWREQNEYNYPALNYLDTDIKNINVYKNQILCIYQVNNENKTPFLQFLFSKNIFSDKFEFLNYVDFDFFKDSATSSDIIERIKTFMISLIDKSMFFKMNLDDLLFQGFLEEGNNNYLFFNIKKLEECFSFSLSTPNNNTFRLGLISEIIRYENIDGNEIEPNIVDFFQRNCEWCYLKNKENENYELPDVGYITKNRQWLGFNSTFGEIKNPNGKLGSYYYFTNYNQAKNDICELKEKKEYGAGIIKFALFLGIMKTFMNKNQTNNYSFDYEDLEWVEVYDSCYYLEKEETPFWVVKNYCQQVPLSVYQ